jgi:type VI secretion system protein
MHNLRLFDRIREGRTPRGDDPRAVHRAAVDSVTDHLRRLLNVREGTTLMNPEYGMPDFTELRATIPDSVKEIENLIAKTIVTYEPRLKNVSVAYTYLDDSFTLYFEIRAKLVSDWEEIPVSLESTLDTGGRMCIRG